ncbi:MAG: glycosyltransferase family 4 protein, partial [Gemmatimonadota bacterium]|nr:glycosyltransferase family 4 protein [Gemmatimonadota bacterium]
MKLLVVNWQDRLNPHAGGAEVHLHETFGRLARAGHTVHFLVSGWEGAPANERVDGIHVHRTGSRYTFGVRAAGAYAERLRGERFDLAVEALNKVPVFAPRWTGIPTVLLVHHLFGATAFREASLPVAAATWLLERGVPRVYRHTPVQVISESTADDLAARGLPRRSIRVIHPGVDTAFFTPAGPRAERPCFVYVGRLKRYKGVDTLIRAFAELAANGCEAELHIAGKGEHETALRALVGRLGLADRVRFRGWVSEAEKRDLFRRAWANVFPSPKEGWGITNVEAAACGTPSVASDAPGLRDSVADGRSGVLFPAGDFAALAVALRRLSTQPQEVERLGRGAREFAESHSWDRTAGQTERH